MTGWTAPERRWRDALVASVVPGAEGPRLAAVWSLLDRSAPPLLRYGLRAAVWALTWLPLLTHGVPLHRLSRPPSLLQPAVLLIKWIGCSARFATCSTPS